MAAVQSRSTQGATTKRLRGRWYHHWLLPLVVFACGWVLAAWFFRPPAPRPVTAAAERFSALRAQRLLRAVFAGEQPHPTGSKHNAEVRQRLMTQLRELGLTPQVQHGYVCRGVNVCGMVHNVVATIAGTAAVDDALLLNAHYDSVPAGPGIGDDASGVAVVLEVARVLLSGQKPQHDVVLLLDDGEEAGLLGARLFMSDHPLARRVRAVVNLEARGSGGASLIFETAGQQDTLLNVLNTVARPLSSSLFVDVYKRLPNDTNFTVFRQYGMAGFNLAFIDEVAHYHTPLDDISHTSTASMQHHGDNAIALLRGLDATNLSALAAGGAPPRVWFDWLGMTMLSITVPRARGLAAGLLVLLLFVAVAWSWSADRRLRSVVTTVVGFLAVMLLPMLALAITVELAKALKATPTPWMGHTPPYMLVMVGAAAAALVLVGHWLRLTRGWLVYSLVWSVWALLGVVVAEQAAVAAHLILVPTLTAALCALVGVLARREERTWLGRMLLLLPVVVTVSMWGRVAIGLVQVAGLWMYPLVAITVLLPLTTLLPALASQPPARPRRWFYGAAGAAAVAAAAALALPAFSGDAPQRMSMVHIQRDSGEAVWLVDTTWGDAPDVLVEQASLGGSVPAPLPNLGMTAVAVGRANTVKAPAMGVTLVATQQSQRTTSRRLRMVSPRQNHTMILLFPPKVPVHRITVDGHPLGLSPLHDSSLWRGYRVAIYLTVAAAGVDVEIEVARGAALEFEVLDVTPGLPTIAAPLLRARGRRGVASQQGDLSILVTKVSFASDAAPE